VALFYAAPEQHRNTSSDCNWGFWGSNGGHSDKQYYWKANEAQHRIISETETRCYAWVLMGNYVHLLLKTGLAPIATVMRRLLTGYAVSFNRWHRCHGQLFQNRYKSFLCEQNVYLKELVRYIHLNPLGPRC